ncbi:hypothetical protein U9M48_008840 [Paspalum notatum var. saurae]|uniref:Uncharacterized protein n=1 Tax=Paspalum notatum var. saurae TaxID=547442 RepID=A0AAQ3SQ27_PASNO
MRPLQRQRIEAPPAATLEDVHPHAKWTPTVEEFLPKTCSFWMAGGVPIDSEASVVTS